MLFTVRFFIEFIKEVQVEFETGMVLNMGQWLSIPFIIAGFVLLAWSCKKHSRQAQK
jgi:phosphatidylglycerol---prolipoprotein diacylglyceryl transferase